MSKPPRAVATPGLGEGAPDDDLAGPAELEGAIFDASPVQMAVLDRELTILRANQAFARGRGRTAEALVGTSLRHALPGDLEVLMRVRDSGEPVTLREVPSAAGGGERYHDWTLSPLAARGARGPARLLSGVDVTTQVEAKQALRTSEALLRDIIDTIAEPIYVKDAESRLILVNPATVRAVGRPIDDIVGHTDGELYPDGGVGEAILQHDRRVMESGTVQMFEETIPTAKGDRVLLNTKAPRRDASGRVIGLVGTARDITERKRAEQALHEGQERLTLALSAGRMAAWDWIIATGETTWNDEHFRMLGYEPGEVVPGYAAWAARLHPDDRAATEARVKASVKGGEYRAEFRVLRPDGSVHWIEARGFMALTPAGEPYRQYGVMIDITERKRAEEALRDSERLYRAIGESIDYGVWVCDPEGRNIYASPSFLALVGLTQEQCSSFGWGDVLHPDDAERTMAAWKACVRAGGTWDIEHRFRGVDGQWHPILARGVAVRNQAGEVKYWAGINLDISRLKETEAALREADRRKDEFLAVLSHELRNPLAPIRNSLFVMEHTAPGGEQARRAQAVIARQVTHLSRLVDDLLDITRIARGKIQLQRERLDLAGLIRRTLEDHRAAIAASELELEVAVPDEPVPIHADPTRIAQVVGNLVENARKFTPRGGRIVASLARDGAEAVVKVRDTGEGIASELLPRLFEPFTQGAQALDRTRGGLGLGLALSRGLVVQHGGTLTATSEGPGRGAELTLRLPIEPEAERTGVAEPTTPPAPGRRVLVIEDNADAALSLRDVLALAGHVVVVAHDGPEGLRAAHTFAPEVVLCDIGLPGMDGYEVARRVRADPALASCLLVALSGYALPEDIARATAAGFDRHLAKPPVLERLAEVMAQRRGHGA